MTTSRRVAARGGGGPVRRVVAVALVAGAGGVLWLAAHGGPPGMRASTSHTRTAQCVVRRSSGDYVPDPACTPGALNPAVTQATIGATICRPGWATAQRKALFPLALSERVKAKLVREYGAYAGAGLRGYELDHLIPIGLGGRVEATTAVHPNLWVESPATPNPKDMVEAAASRAVCKGRMALADAQRGMASDWPRLGQVLGVPEPARGNPVVDLPPVDGD